MHYGTAHLRSTFQMFDEFGDGGMKARVSKWAAWRPVAEGRGASLQVHEGGRVDLVIEGETLLIRARRPHYSLEELVAAMRPENQPEILDVEPFPSCWVVS